MELKNVSQNKLFFTYGLIGTILYFIAIGGSSFIPCNGKEKVENDNNTYIYEYICKVNTTYNIPKPNDTYFYFENFTLYYKKFTEKKILNY